MNKVLDLTKEIREKLREKKWLEAEKETWRLAHRVYEELNVLNMRYTRLCRRHRIERKPP